jgi:hypothetical protein
MEGIFPESWKQSTIIPIPKVPQETRPINLMPSYEKILEIAAHRQISEYFEQNNLLHNQQFGFRWGRSTETALQMIFSSWRSALNENKFVVAVSIDLKRAFEMVSRTILLKKTWILWGERHSTQMDTELLDKQYPSWENWQSSIWPYRVWYGSPSGIHAGTFIIHNQHKWYHQSGKVFKKKTCSLMIPYYIEGDDFEKNVHWI